MVIGDLSSAAETRDLAGQVNQIGRMDAVIHNAAVFLEPSRSATAEGHAKTLAVNTLAPYLLTALTARPGRPSTSAAGCITPRPGPCGTSTGPGGPGIPHRPTPRASSTSPRSPSRVWPDVLSNAVDPGWVPAKMGSAAATRDLEMGYLTQTWLAVSNDAAATVSGGYWYHRQRQPPAPPARDPALQDQLMDRLAALTDVTLF